MGNTCACTRGLKGVSSSKMGGSNESEHVAGTAIGYAPSSSSLHLSARSVSIVDKMAESGSNIWNVVEQQIEQSKSHWSLLAESDSDFTEEEVEADNREVFKALQSHSTWGDVFFSSDDFASLSVGEKFAEGRQAELFHAQVKWSDPKTNEYDREHGIEWVLKVFKKGTLLRHLQKQWPHGMFQYRAEQVEKWKSPTHPTKVQCGTLFEDGRFAFLLKREPADLRSSINHNIKMTTSKNCGPFSRENAEESMFNVALGMDWLHRCNIVHRDLKASNVLVKIHNNGRFQCFVGDYECSIGVVGTGSFRASEILDACKDKSASKRPELFTKSSDVYSYGMTCYEILTRKLPFDGHHVYDLDLVLHGPCPEVPVQRCPSM